MNKPTRIITLLAFSAFFASQLHAQEGVELKVIANGSDGVASASSVVTIDSKLRFSKEGVEVYSGETLTCMFPYSATANLSFEYDKGTGVKMLDASGTWKLRSNPVAESLQPYGKSVDAARLTVTDLSGAVKITLPAWHGEAVDVSDMTPGLYFVTIDKTTLKFIKK